MKLTADTDLTRLRLRGHPDVRVTDILLASTCVVTLDQDIYSPQYGRGSRWSYNLDGTHAVGDRNLDLYRVDTIDWNKPLRVQGAPGRRVMVSSNDFALPNGMSAVALAVTDHDGVWQHRVMLRTQDNKKIENYTLGSALVFENVPERRTLNETTSTGHLIRLHLEGDNLTSVEIV